SRRAREFWTERKVAWYQRALERSDYAERVLEVLAPLLAVCDTALDVGAGCGALALPLAGRLRQVTALEPAAAMTQALSASARARGLQNIEVIEAGWGQVSVAPHDLVLCAHVGDLLRPQSPFLREVSSMARHGVALVRDAGPERDKFFFRELYPLLLGRPYTPGCDYEETVDGLARLGTSPRVTPVSYRSDQPFDNLEEACDFWMEYLGVEGEHIREFLREFLGKRLVREASGWVARYPKRAAVIWWPVGG
ncbi:MAG: class I SAM-dependent methyltransferase, partial [Anaerolineae bacterium]